MKTKVASIVVTALLSVFIIRTFKNPLVYLACLGFSGLAIVKLDEGVEPGEYMEFAGEVSQDFITAVDPKRTYAGLKEFFIEPDKSFKAIIAKSKEIKVDYSWFEKFRSKAALVVGVTKDGKTFFLLNELANFITSKGKLTSAILRIGDIDYMMSHEGSVPNDWYGLPEDQFISTSYEQILEDLRYFCKLMDERVAEQRKNPNASNKWQWGLHIIDELPDFISESKDRGDYDEVSKKIKKMLNRGLKCRIKAYYGCQNLSFADSGISLSAQETFNIILLGTTSINRSYLERIGVKGSKQQDQIIERVKKLREVNPYACVIRSNQVVSAETLPEFKNEFRYENPYEVWEKSTFGESTLEWLKEFAPKYMAGEGDIQEAFTLCFADDRRKQEIVRRYITEIAEAGDDVQSWWLKTFTPELKAEWESKIKQYRLGKSKSPLKPCMGMIFKTSEMRKDNPKYIQAKKIYEEILNSQ